MRRRQIEQDALKQFRRTRNKIDPDVLDDLRDVIQQSHQDDVSTGTLESTTDLKIDREKNLETIERFLQLSSQKEAIKSMMAEIITNKS